MKGPLKYLTMSAAAVVFVSGLIAGSASFARAHDTASPAGDDGVVSAPSVATQPDKALPLDFGGCWDGTGIDGSLEDNSYGPGVGWIGIDQSGKSIKGGGDSYYEFLFDDGAYAYGTFKGKASATGFSVKGKAGGKCRVKIIGTFGSDDDIVGTYDFTHCQKTDFTANGTFDLPLNDSGCIFVTPP